MFFLSDSDDNYSYIVEGNFDFIFCWVKLNIYCFAIKVKLIFFFTEYFDIGVPSERCAWCGALMFRYERLKKDLRALNPMFSLCCMQGKVQLPLLKEPPEFLKELLLNNSIYSSNFLRNIRSYNMMFSFTSMGGKLQSPSSSGNGPYVYQLHGQNVHYMGSLLPPEGDSPKFSQLYVYDTDNEVSNRLSSHG